MFPCEVRHEAARPTLSMRFRAPVGELTTRFGVVYGAIIAYLQALGEEASGAPFAAYYNMDMENLDIEAGFPVARRLPGKGEIIADELAEGLFAVCHYVGPYDGVSVAYDALTDFARESGYTPSGIAYEWYFDGPEVPPEKTRTEVAFPVTPVDKKMPLPH